MLQTLVDFCSLMINSSEVYHNSPTFLVVLVGGGDLSYTPPMLKLLALLRLDRFLRCN